MAKSPTRSQEDLQAIAQHVMYEKMMLDYCANQLTDAVAYTAAFIHLRNLLDFLYRPRGRMHRDQVLAEHFFDAPVPEWNKLRCPLPHAVKKFRPALDTLAAHLSYDRLTLGHTGDGQLRADYIAHLNATWDQFLSALTPARAAWFRAPDAKM